MALGKRPADMLLRVGRLLDVHTAHLARRSGDRHPRPAHRLDGTGRSVSGTAARRGRTEADLAAVPGFGEVHKHIESSHITPEYEAALVLPRGNTWTCEASHEFSNVDGAAQSRILADRAAARLADEDLPAARLGRAAHRL